MNKFIISYDLKAKNADYTSLYDAIKSAEGWWHYLESFWIITSSYSLTFWQEKIKANIKSEDFFIVVEVRDATTNGWLPKNAWDWINQNTSPQIR